MVSNEGVVSMLNTMNRQMVQQHRSHQILMREKEGLRTEIRRPPVPAASALRPRILNFDTSGSLHNHSEPIIPTTTITTEGVTPQVQADTFQDPGEMFANTENHNAGNPSTNNTFFTNLADMDAGISPQMAKELRQLR